MYVSTRRNDEGINKCLRKFVCRQLFFVRRISCTLWFCLSLLVYGTAIFFFHNIVLPDAIVLDGIQIEFFLLPRDWRKSCNLFVDKHYYLLYWGL